MKDLLEISEKISKFTGIDEKYFIIAFKYRVNFLFFITRILGTVKSIFITY